MDYILKSKQYYDDEHIIKVQHNEEKIVTIFIQHGLQKSEDFKSLGTDFSESELHDLIGTLLHIKAKMRGGKNG